MGSDQRATETERADLRHGVEDLAGLAIQSRKPGGTQLRNQSGISLCECSLILALFLGSFDTLPEFRCIPADIAVDNAVTDPSAGVPVAPLGTPVLQHRRSADCRIGLRLVCFEQVLIGGLNRERKGFHTALRV